MSWPLVEIGKLVEKVSSWNPIKSGEIEQFNYIDLSSVDKDKKIVSLENVPSLIPSEAPSRARQLVKSDDVLVATVRPNLNGVAKVPKKLEGATASTGYCVLRAKQNDLDSGYLYYWVQTLSFVSDMMSKATGANYPAVSDKIIKQSKIPLPPLEEQKRIAAILDKADSVRRKRQQAIDLADDFLRSVFLDMFGDPISNPKGWNKATLVKIAPAKPLKGLSHESNDQIWLLNLDAVESQTGKIISKLVVPYEKVGSSTNHFDTSHVLYSKLRPYLNKVVLPDETGVATSELIPLKPNLEVVTREFLVSYLRSEAFVNWANGKVAGAKMPRLSTTELWKHEVYLPPMELQIRFSEIFARISEIKEKKIAAKKLTEESFNSLSQKAFAGEL